MRVIRFHIRNIRKKINDVFLLMHIGFLISVFSSFMQFSFLLLKHCNYSRYFSLQISERKEFISQEKAERKS